MNGTITHMGALIVEGEKMTGVFIKCTVDELKRGKDIFFEDVTITLQSDADGNLKNDIKIWRGKRCQQDIRVALKMG